MTSSPESAYALVADIQRMAELSPECEACWWIDDASSATNGARFRGRSRRGRHRWTTTSEIVEAIPGQRISWKVSYWRRPVAQWTYEFLDLGNGRTEVKESCVDERGAVLRRISPLLTGSKDRTARNAETMDATLLNLKALAET